jgi:GT2 family glycosyltransferase
MQKISIVIPCRNEKLYIEECIRAIKSAFLPDDFISKIYVVDGMSDDGTREIVQALQQEFSDVYLINNEKQLTPFAFNLGIYAGGKVDYVQIIGARHIISENYLIECVRILQEDSSIWCVGGKIINEYTSKVSKAVSLAMSTSFGMGIGNFRTLKVSGFTDTVTSPMYPYHVFEKIGFFDEVLIRNQDDDFNFRVTKASGKIYFEAGIFLKYFVRGNYKNLWRQFFQYGYWKVFVNKKHRIITTLRQIVPPCFVIYFMLFPFVFFLGDLFGLVALMPLIIYLILNLINSYKVKTKDIEFYQIALVFPILHLSYGFGYLRGLFDFFILNKKPSERNKQMTR